MGSSKQGKSVLVLPETVEGVGDFAQGVVLDRVQGRVAGQLTVKKRRALHGLADFELAQGITVTVE